MKRIAWLLLVVGLAMALTGCFTLPDLALGGSSGGQVKTGGSSGGQVIRDDPGGASGAQVQPGAKPGTDLSNLVIGNNDVVELGPGTYTGDLVIDANNSELWGAGIGRTVIRGNVTIDGNSNQVIGVTIIGAVYIYGNTNNLTESDLSQAKVTADGNRNLY